MEKYFLKKSITRVLSFLLISVTAFAQGDDEVLSDKVLMTSKRWTVSTSLKDSVFGKESCQAQTINSSTLNQDDVELTLKVMNLKNTQTLGYNEPVVVLTAEATSKDLSDLLTMSLRSSSDRVDYQMDLIFSLSNEGKRVFISKIEDRADLISKLARKNTVTAKFFKGIELVDSSTFSLSGSFKAILGQSATDPSLNNKCGGVDILAGL